MLKRIIIGALLAAFTIGVLYLGKVATWISIYSMLLVAAFEMTSAFKKAGILVQVAPIAVFVAGMPFLVHFYAMKGLMSLLILSCMITFIMQLFRAEASMQSMVYTIFVLFYPLTMIALLAAMLTFPGVMGRIAIACTVVCATATDIGAYFVGVAVGRHKLCPNISPKKTIEGSAGGLVCGIAAGILIKTFLLPPDYYIYASYVHFVVLGAICSALAQMGDLVASVIKRSVGIKDYGTIFPGHGGVMDRLDSIIFVAPAVYIYFSLVLLG